MNHEIVPARWSARAILVWALAIYAAFVTTLGLYFGHQSDGWRDTAIKLRQRLDDRDCGQAIRDFTHERRSSTPCKPGEATVGIGGYGNGENGTTMFYDCAKLTDLAVKP